MADSFELHRQRRQLFAADVEAYDRGRPGYPPEVYERLQRVCGLAAGSEVLEIGPGTGQATGPLLELGARVTAVELGNELCQRLAAKFPARPLTVVAGAFEDVELRPGSFDLVAAATSFHWVPVPAGFDRVAGLLRPGGWLALWWNVFGDPAWPDPFHEALTPLLERIAPQLVDVPGSAMAATGAHHHALDVAARTGEIDRTGRFGPVIHEVIAWTGRHTPAEVRSLFATFSPWLALDGASRQRLLDELEALAAERFGIVERRYLTPIYLAQRLDQRAPTS
jgi:SAM-dependent methyltransferase